MGVYTVNQTDGSLQRVAGGTLYADAPIGAIQSYGGVIAPAGWLICDGSAVSRTEYAELFAVIGINFGEGDGETTFGIPDLRECVPVGVGKNITKSIGAHDRYELGQFKDDQVQANYKVSFLPASFSWGASGGGSSAYGGTNANLRIGDNTHGKRLGVNYIIKAKMVGVPADLEAQIDADYQKKDLTTPLTIGGVSQTTVEGALGALQSAKVDSSTLGRFKTFTVTLSPGTQRTISFSNVAKRVRIDIDSTGANNNTQFHGVLVGYNEMTSNRLIGLYKRGTNGLLASMGSYELTLANPSPTATDTVILTFYNLAGNITTTISNESAITLTEMGDGWQELVTESDISYLSRDKLVHHQETGAAVLYVAAYAWNLPINGTYVVHVTACDKNSITDNYDGIVKFTYGGTSSTITNITHTKLSGTGSIVAENSSGTLQFSFSNGLPEVCVALLG